MAKRKRHRGRRRAAAITGAAANHQGIQASVRRPVTPAAIGVASVMLTTTAFGQSGSDVLPTIDVQGDKGGGYQATQSSMSRMPTPLLDTPQTVNVVTQKVIQDQRSTTM